MRRLVLSLLAAGAVVAAGCGSSGGDPDTDPAALAPASAPIYAEISLEPNEDFKAVASKLSGEADPTGKIIQLLERSTNEGGGDDISWEKDLEPWVGDRVGVYFTSLSDDDSQGAVIAPAEDEDKAEEFLSASLKEKGDEDKPPQVSTKKHQDVEYQLDSANDNAYVIVDGTAVIGTEQGVRGAIDASKGESLAETKGLETARDQVDDDGLVFGYMAVREFASAFGGGELGAQFDQLVGQTGDHVAVSGDVEDDAIEFETASIGVKNPVSADPGTLVSDMPADAWLAGGVADLGKFIDQTLKELEASPQGKQLTQALSEVQRSTGIDVRADVLSWIGGAGVFVRGTSINDLGGALIVTATDPAKPKKLLGDLQTLAKQAGDASLKPLNENGVEGVTIRTGEVPMPVHVGVVESKVVVAFGDEALKEAVAPSSKLGDSPEYKAAAEKLGDDMKPALFANLDPVKSLIEASGVLQEAGDDADEIKRVLDHLGTVAAGASTEGDVQRTKFVVSVK